MPVPVPVFSKQPAHPVIKINHSLLPNSKSSVFQHLTHSLPLPPQGPPPSFASREEWISSLPSWRRNKPRRIWEEDAFQAHDSHQGFNQGLAVADNAPAIKGELAQVYIPPLHPAPPSAHCYTDMYLPSDEMDDEMSGYSATMQDWHSEDDVYVADVSSVTQKLLPGSPLDATMDYPAPARAVTRSYSPPDVDGPYAAYHRGAFSPVLEDYSPEVPENSSPADGAEPGSSPIGPATPFADYVDHVFAETQLSSTLQRNRDAEIVRAPLYLSHDGYHASCYQCQTYNDPQAVQQAPVGDSVVTPVATAAYKKLAAPLAEWIVNYVWKSCTNGMRLPPEYAQPMAFVKHYPSVPPSHLVASTHSMLLSTLLQPSAVFLALWYIVRLPVFFGPVCLGLEHAKEMRFRAELLGEAHLGTDREMIEAYAPFRLILLGCMLANKWLDDHTFSNKTWHTISNVPIRSLNQLEACALDIFHYDLSVSPQQWSTWLSDLMAYHQTMSSPSFPQPISRPSSSPHVIIRQALELLLSAQPVDCGCGGNDAQARCMPPQPVFVSLEEQKMNLEIDDTPEDDILEIDLDEDGPLREEYLPKRRSSRSFLSTVLFSQAERALPPPAKWSPAGDEPIIRDHRSHGQYVAPQPVTLPVVPPPPFQGVQHPSWSMGYLMRQDPVNRPTIFAPLPVLQAPVPGFDYGYNVPPIHHGHARSHSLSYNQTIGDPTPGRLRSFSQTQYDHLYSDVRVEIPYALPPPTTSQWATYDRVGFPTSYDRPPRPSLKA